MNHSHSRAEPQALRCRESKVVAMQMRMKVEMLQKTCSESISLASLRIELIQLHTGSVNLPGATCLYQSRGRKTIRSVQHLKLSTNLCRTVFRTCQRSYRDLVLIKIAISPLCSLTVDHHGMAQWSCCLTSRVIPRNHPFNLLLNVSPNSSVRNHDHSQLALL